MQYLTTKPKSFFFHFNKPASRIAGKPQISLHFNQTCHIVDNVKCEVPTLGRIRKIQPVFIMVGKYKSIVIDNRVAIIS